MISAEELGVTSKNADSMKSSKNPEIRRLLGAEAEMGKQLGVGNDWAYSIIKNVGNYAESYERNIGVNTPLKLVRGVNALWSQGGIMYSPPFR